MKSEDYILKESCEGIATFLQSLDGPNDIYKQVVLEEFFKLLFEMLGRKVED